MMISGLKARPNSVNEPEAGAPRLIACEESFSTEPDDLSLQKPPGPLFGHRHGFLRVSAEAVSPPGPNGGRFLGLLFQDMRERHRRGLKVA